ncbi:MAG: hypothetical protein RXR21_00890 [Nitrososphaeria archaeon]
MKLMFISDVRNFQFSDSLIKLFKPDYFFFLGDVLFDGPGQFYFIKKGERLRFADVEQLSKENRAESFEDYTMFKGNTHVSKELFKVHLYYFLKTLKLLEELGIGYALINGNHDSFIDYGDIFLHNNLRRGVFVKGREKFKLADTEILLIAYGSSFDSAEIKNSKIIATHERRFILQKIIRNLGKCSGAISGHYGIDVELYSGGNRVASSPYEKLLIKIDDFPFSFAVYENEKFSLYRSNIVPFLTDKLKIKDFNVTKRKLCTFGS